MIIIFNSYLISRNQPGASREYMQFEEFNYYTISLSMMDKEAKLATTFNHKLIMSIHKEIENSTFTILKAPKEA